MTKEELKQEAEKHADAYATPDLEDSFRVYIYEANKDGYIVGAEPREKRIAELEKENAELKEKYNELSKAVFELKGEFMACPLDDTDRLGELIDRLNNL